MERTALISVRLLSSFQPFPDYIFYAFLSLKNMANKSYGNDLYLLNFFKLIESSRDYQLKKY